jgi:hypothetical protein
MSDQDREDDEQPEPGVNLARRRLLKMAKYVPPIVIGAISLQQAGCQPDPTCSCQPNPSACAPMAPAPSKQPDQSSQSEPES